ncbi:ZIP zinc/iron transport family [Hypoxylon rubiginosum]|uniref:ZIP zinc/iron transport family n=1 Tax=Hypoxylon rubiginosum TaxID=110542 RepID=A0ACB9YRR9_9PEZI|nr:ZIP zinc/iron transport family [Hypoxylon rubiginosum]
MSILHTALDAVLQARQDADSSDAAPESGFSVTIDCDTGNEYDGRMGVRISSIFVILVGSLLGAVLPVYLARGTKMKVNGTAFFVAKYFGSGVIIGTAFMHLLSPAFDALRSPCLPEGPINDYDWAAGICLMTVFVMFTIELLVSRFDFFGHDHSDAKAVDPSLDVLKKGSQTSEPSPTRDVEAGQFSSKESRTPHNHSHSLGIPDDVSYPPGGEDHLGHQREHGENDSHSAFAAQMTALFILEFGVVFHSIFIGLTLAVAGEEFTVLYIVLVFHQTFEGLGLGSRLATAQWPRSKAWMPYALACGYAISTPVSIAIGLGVRTTLQPGSPKSLLINGVFDAISAGILIYTGLVELLAHEFMFNSYMRNAGLKVQLFALGCVALGCGLMAVLAEWA